MKISINLAAQDNEKHRTFYLVLGILGILYIGLTLLIPDWGFNPSYFIWIPLLPDFIEAILYGLGRNRIFADHFPYLKIDDEKIEESKGGLFAKPSVSYWADVRKLDIKLFEIQLTCAQGKNKTIDLTNLTDDNLRLVKQCVANIKNSRGL